MLSKLFGHLAQMKTTVFFSILFFYLLCLSFQGLDFNDEGFHVAFYQQIFSDPGSVQYGFWMWLTGIFGGLFLKIFPFLGLWGIRLEGTICLLATIGVAYRLLAKYLNPGTLRLSIFILVLFINEFPRTFYYNNFSGFCYLIGAFFLYRGLKENKTLSILLSGLVVCLNIFNRTPNLLGLGIWIAIPYYEYLTQKSFKSLVRKTVYFFAGILSGLLFVFITMKLLGHLDIFINSMKMVFGLSREIKSNDGLEGAYQISKLFIVNIQEYAGSIRAVFLVLFLILLTATVNKFAKTENRLVG